MNLSNIPKHIKKSLFTIYIPSLFINFQKFEMFKIIQEKSIYKDYLISAYSLNDKKLRNIIYYRI